MSKSVGVIGAGVAGLAIAIRLALKGYKITIFESNDSPGGKLSEFKAGKYRFDAGPSLFTMPQLVEELFSLAGKNPAAFRYQKLDILAHYFFADGTFVKAYADKQQLANELEVKLNEPAQNTLNALKTSATLYNVLGDLFMTKPLNHWRTFVSRGALTAYSKIPQLGFLSTMHEANNARFKDQRTVQLFDRYATYNGSNPYQTPATMNIIPHLEYGMGGFLPERGMHQITEALFQLALERGVNFRFNTKIDQITFKNNRATGLNTGAQSFSFDYIISNMDMVATYRRLLPGLRHPKGMLDQPKSSSALIFYWGIKKEFPNLSLHNIFFSGNYRQEFQHLFQQKTIYADPTVYVNITSKHIKSDAPKGCENWFTMVNVPPNEGQDWETLIAEARANTIAKLSKALNCDIASLIEVENRLDPITIESRTSSWQGALYGNSSNNRYAAFLRHPNKSSKLKNLYFCGGSVHPGGGIPLCLSSAKIVSDYFPQL